MVDLIDTIADWSIITDGGEVDGETWPYITAVQHPAYLDAWIEVEEYNFPDDAEAGHKRWVEALKGDLPDYIVDIAGKVYKCKR